MSAMMLVFWARGDDDLEQADSNEVGKHPLSLELFGRQDC